MHFFQLEMAAKQLYLEQFGEWPTGSDGESSPEILEDERLFDHQRVADSSTVTASESDSERTPQL